MGAPSAPAPLTKKDFKSDQEVRWCPGCGDYAILNMVQTVMAGLGIPKHEIVFVSGIGCSSRFPYYMNTYGFHTIHGRAPAFATGIKSRTRSFRLARDRRRRRALDRREPPRAHPAPERGHQDPDVQQPDLRLDEGPVLADLARGAEDEEFADGAVDRPFPIAFALGCNATFVARTIDTHQKHMQGILEAAAQHKGTAFLEIYQNCNIFNDGAFDDIANRDVRDDHTVDLKPGKPLVYGRASDKGIKIDAMETKVVPAAEATTWNASTKSGAPAYVLAEMDLEKPAKPVPIGIFRSIEAPTYDEEVNKQVGAAIAKRGQGKLRDLIWSGETWQVS
jgi:2-oxoglutarate ferredoxin oxidoreductase subunit beta